MRTTEEVVDMLREFKRTEGEKYGIEQLGLFGSFARGEQNENSDIDVCIKFGKTSFRTYMASLYALEKLFDTKVDLLTLHGNIRQYFRQKLDRDAIYV